MCCFKGLNLVLGAFVKARCYLSLIGKGSVFGLQGVCGCDKYSSSSIGEVIKSVVIKDGYHGLMRGWIPRMLFHAPAAAICWSTYEASKSFFQRLNETTNPNTMT